MKILVNGLKYTQVRYNAFLGLPTTAASPHPNSSKVANCTLRVAEHSLYEGVFALKKKINP